jgi:LCP family protein required for cell wall assembly
MDSNTEREEDGTREDFRTDTMLLVSIDFDKKRVDMITVPRDSYVTVTNATGKLYKVNSAAFFGGGMCHSGFLNACDTISGVFGGLPVNYYVAVDMDGLKALVDAIGGVYYDVDLDASLDGITLNKGYQILNGEQVLTYCRLRKGIGNSKDVERQERQQRMLVAVLKTLKQNGKIENIGPIYDSLKDMVYTNLTFEQICALGIFFSGFDDFNNIHRHVLKGEYHWAYGVYFYLLDQQAKADLVKEIFGKEIEIDKKHDLKYVLAHTPPQDTGKDEDKDSDPEDAPEPDDEGLNDPGPQESPQTSPANSEALTSAPTENPGSTAPAPESPVTPETPSPAG